MGIEKGKEMKMNNMPVKNEKEENLCVICLTNTINTVFYTCGHMCCCLQCSEIIQRDKCPICRLEITDVIKTFNVN